MDPVSLGSTARATQLDAENPWPGLSWFEENGAAFFNGRQRETAELKRLLLQAPLTVLFGRSGLGKTSLLKAGLFPDLRRNSMLPIYTRLNFAAGVGTAGGDNLLVEQLGDAFEAACLAARVDALARAPGEALWDYLHRSDFRLWSAQNQPVTPVFVLDQFEEVFTLGAARPAAVNRLREDLADLIENRIPTPTEARLAADEAAGESLSLRGQRYRFLLSFREDFATAFESWHEVPSLMRNRLQLMPMSGEQALEASHKTGAHLMDRPIAEAVVRFVASVKRPSGAASSGVGPQDDSAPLADLAIEPALLSLVCRGLNERRKREGKPAIDRDTLSHTGPQVIEGHYDDCMDDQPERVHRFVENELVTESGFRKPCSQDDARREPYAIDLAALQVLVDRRLLRMEPSLGVTRVELMHDLLTPTVLARRDARRKADAARRLQEELRQQQAERDKAAAAEEERVRARRRLRTVSLWAGGIAVIAAALGVTASYAFLQRDRAEAQETRARRQAVVAKSRELAAATMARLDLDPALALSLAVEAARVAPTLQAESALRQALLKSAPKPDKGSEGAPSGPVRWLAGHKGHVLSVDLSPDGRVVLSTGCDRTARLWAAESGRSLRTLEGHGNAVMVGVFSRDGRWIATAGGNYCPGVPPEKDSPVGAGDTKVRIWDAASGEGVAVLEGAPRLLMSATFSPDGRSLAAGGWDGTVYVWDVASRRVRKLGLHEGGIQAVAYSPDGRRLATAGLNKFVSVWDADTGQRVATLEHEDHVMALSYSSDGASLASADLKGLVRIWDTRNWSLRREMNSYGLINAAAFSGDGQFIITAGNKVLIWETATGSRVQPVAVEQGSSFGAAFSSDGRRLVVGGSSGVALFDCPVCVPLDELMTLAARRLPRPLSKRERDDFLGTDEDALTPNPQ